MGFFNRRANRSAVFGSDYDELRVIVDHVLDIRVLLSRLVIGERQDDFVPGLFELGFQVVAVLVPSLFGFRRHRDADGVTLGDGIIRAARRLPSSSTAARGQASAHRHTRQQCHDLLRESHRVSFDITGGPLRPSISVDFSADSLSIHDCVQLSNSI